MEQYQYQPLASKLNDIRLMRLLPGSGGDDVQCEIFHYNLRAGRAFGLYEALSYVWGDPREPKSVLVRNPGQETYRYLNVTTNLYIALKRLRDVDLPRTLWIDAICINQEDIHERAAQVQFMARIFASALHVTVWLGDHTDGSAELFETLRNLTEEVSQHDIEKPPSSLGRRDQVEASLRKLLKRPWFSRVWVLQEVAVARFMSVTCGTSSLVGSVFRKGTEVLAFHLYRHEQQKKLPLPAVLSLIGKTENFPCQLHNVATTDNIASVESLSMFSLPELLDSFHAHSATDSRDKIYALLGLATQEPGRVPIRADYRKSWSNLFQEAIIQILGSDAKIHTSDKKEQALISVDGCPLGTIDMMPQSNTWFFRSSGFHGIKGQQNIWTGTLLDLDQAKTVMEGDIFCLFKGAHWPSVVRHCGDHFDIIIIAHKPPLRVFLERQMDGRNTSREEVLWHDFVDIVSDYPRIFNLVWDWDANTSHAKGGPSEPIVNHHQLQSWEQISPHSQLSNTLRILEDMDRKTDMAGLAESRLASKSSSMSNEYLELIKYVCLHWHAYAKLKAHITQLRWCGLLLSDQATVDTERPLWLGRGILDLDLFSIKSLKQPDLALRIQESYDELHMASLSEEESLEGLLSMIFPARAALLRNAISDHGTSVLSLHDRYLLELTLRGLKDTIHLSEEAVELLFSSSWLNEAALLSLIVVSRYSTSGIVLSNQLLNKIHISPYTCDFLSFLLRECAPDQEKLYTILKAAHKKAADGQNRNSWQRTWQAVLLPNVQLLYQAISQTSLCQFLAERWDSDAREVGPVLQYLCETFHNPPRSNCKVSNGATRLKKGWCIGDKGSCWRRDDSLTNSEAAAIAQTCLLDAMRPWMESDAKTMAEAGEIGERGNVAMRSKLLKRLRGVVREQSPASSVREQIQEVMAGPSRHSHPNPKAVRPP